MPRSSISVPTDWERSGLPGWTYFSQPLFEVEKNQIFRTHWQYACHVSEVTEVGQYVTFDIADERALVICGKDGVVRAFHNLCRHRGSRIVGDEKGQCNKALVCPYHGWAYNLDGTLRGVAAANTFPPMNPEEWGLKTIEMEIWHGFIFIRFQPGPQPAMAEILARFEEEVAPYKPEDMVIDEGSYATDTADVNWKSVRDVDNEGYHVRQAHPGLHDLYGAKYFDEPYVDGASRSIGYFNEAPSKGWSTRHYRAILPEARHLPKESQKAWLYVGVFPNLVFGFYPDSMVFYQEIPHSATKTVQRGAVFKHRNEDRRTRAARYLSQRIDRDTAKEDQMLTIWSCEATKSSAFDGIILSDLEYGLKTFHDHLRKVVPVMNLTTEPTQLASENQTLLVAAE
mgnify:CR=1 FL=1